MGKIGFEMDLKGKSVLVTGADGFIGSHLVEDLLAAGARVRAFVFYNSFNSCGWLDTLPDDVFKRIEIFSGDIRDPHGVREAMRDIEIVFHLAALIGIPFSYHSPDSYVDTNVKGTLNILQAARLVGTELVIHTSTSEVYGSAQFVPITEKHPLNAQSPYAATKVAADQLALSFHAAFELPVMVVRPFNTYGPRQSARAVIPTVISQIASGKSEIQIGSIEPTRDFTFVNDTTAGFIAAAKHPKLAGQVFNLGCNFEISIADTIDFIADVFGRKVSVRTDEQRIRPEQSEVDRLWSDNSKALAQLAWKPRYASREGFKKGLAETVEWFSKPENLRRYKPHAYNL